MGILIFDSDTDSLQKIENPSLSLAGGALSLIPDAECDVGLLLLPQSS